MVKKVKVIISMFVGAGFKPAPADTHRKPISSISRIWVFSFSEKGDSVVKSESIIHGNLFLIILCV